MKEKKVCGGVGVCVFQPDKSCERGSKNDFNLFVRLFLKY